MNSSTSCGSRESTWTSCSRSAKRFLRSASSSRNITDAVRRLPKRRVTLDPGSSSRTLLMMESTGVMPLPAAMARWCREAPGWVGHEKDPSGVMTSRQSPAAMVSLSQFDIRPPATRAAATRRVPVRSATARERQIE